MLRQLGLPEWGDYLVRGILLFAWVASAAVALSRAGRNPYLAFVLLVPYIHIVAVWIFALSVWPKRPVRQGDSLWLISPWTGIRVLFKI